MRPIDLIYRFHATDADFKPPPANAEEARQVLEAGNRQFVRWIDSCQDEPDPTIEAQPFIFPCTPNDLGLPSPEGQAAKQTPFAAMLGCADARVPAELIFGQMRNNLFVVRVAGNVLSDECQGSLEFAMHNIDTVKVMVVLGHTSCGAVRAAVETYLDPAAYLATSSSAALRKILDRLFVPVRGAAEALKAVWGPNAPQLPQFRTALIETAVAVNVLVTAFHLHQALQQQGNTEIQVLYGVFDLITQRIWTVPTNDNQIPNEAALANAPTEPAELQVLAIRAATWATGRVERNT